MRSAYRAAGEADLASYNLGVRLVRNADYNRTGTVNAKASDTTAKAGGKVLIVYFSWGGNTRKIAKLAPDAVLEDGLSIHYSGGSSMSKDVSAWLKENGII